MCTQTPLAMKILLNLGVQGAIYAGIGTYGYIKLNRMHYDHRMDFYNHQRRIYENQVEFIRKHNGNATEVNRVLASRWIPSLQVSQIQLIKDYPDEPDYNLDETNIFTLFTKS